MKFLLDANIPYSAKEIFSNHEVLHVRDVDLEDATDKEILEFAKNNDRILVTRDLDFANIITYPPRKHPGIVVLRVPFYFTARNIKIVLSRFLDKVRLQDVEKTTTIVEPARFRIRPLRKE